MFNRKEIMMRSWFCLKWFALCMALLPIIGCASHGVITNTPKTEPVSAEFYAVGAGGDGRNSGDISLFLAFSGGGTRAAALAYGVLEELRGTRVMIDGHPQRLLDEVDTISSVSGGSFTSAYYGLYGDRIFEDFEDIFLKRDVQGLLVRGLFSPSRWFSRTGRTDMAVEFYEESVFHGATFADMKRSGGPLILINASDLGYGVRFSFIQEYFNLLCSDIASFPVARAVTASSAVPVLFYPVVVKNYQHCKSKKPDWMAAAERRAENDQELSLIVEGIQSYYNKDRRKYAHFVDGGITDNLGLRAFYDIIELAGGAQAFQKSFDRKPPRSLVIISVDASVNPEPEMDGSNNLPSMEETINAVTDAQIRRYSAATLELMDQSVRRWAQELSTPNRSVTPYFIRVGLKDAQTPEERQYFDRIPTGLSLSDEQVDRLIAAGKTLLRQNQDYQRLLTELNHP